MFLILFLFLLMNVPLFSEEKGGDGIASLIGEELSVEEKRALIRASAITWQGRPPSLHRFFGMEIPEREVQPLVQALLELGLDPNEEDDKGDSAAVALLKSSLKPETKVVLFQQMLSHQLKLGEGVKLRSLTDALVDAFEGDKLQFVLYVFFQWLQSAEFPAMKHAFEQTLTLKKEKCPDGVRLMMLLARMEELAWRRELASVFSLGGNTELPKGFLPLEGMTPSQSHRFLQGLDRLVEEKIVAFLFERNSQEKRYAENTLSDGALRQLYLDQEESKRKIMQSVRRVNRVMEDSLAYLKDPVPELVRRIERGEMVAFKVTGSHHLYGVIFYKGNIYICNKGLAYIDEPGIYRAKIGDGGGLAELIMRFKEGRPLQETLGLTKEDRPIFTLLKAEEGTVFVRGKPQKVGNCTVASSTLMFQTALTLLLEEEKVEGAREIAAVIKSMQRKWRREIVLRKYLTHHVKKGGIDPISVDPVILTKILLQEQKEGKGADAKAMILHWILHESVDQKIKEMLIGSLK
ncbi:hypothetical protein [Estrella lausannensis]|uniref:hypothetical protein n=1 Tax=Estrella lausannensis TaxID=483423 RepID=UPI000BF0784E|nr:hypothetical protein [Estrella lausannensis]